MRKQMTKKCTFARTKEDKIRFVHLKKSITEPEEVQEKKSKMVKNLGHYPYKAVARK